MILANNSDSSDSFGANTSSSEIWLILYVALFPFYSYYDVKRTFIFIEQFCLILTE